MRVPTSEYNPESWVLLKIQKDNEKPLYKVFGAWRGGYATGDYWRFNSGIKSYEVDDTFVYFYGYTGSCYKCKLNTENILSYYHMSVLNSWYEESKGVLSKISFEDFAKEFKV